MDSAVIMIGNQRFSVGREEDGASRRTVRQLNEFVAGVRRHLRFPRGGNIELSGTVPFYIEAYLSVRASGVSHGVFASLN